MNFNFNAPRLSTKKLLSVLLAALFVLGACSSLFTFGFNMISKAAIVYASGDTSGDASGDASGDPGIPPEITSENYTIKIKNTQGLLYIRMASGILNTAKEIKNAPDLVTLDAEHIAYHTDNGIFTYEMPDGGDYSFWLKYDDGNTYIIHHSLNNFHTRYSINGLNLTFHNVYGIKDIFIATGTQLSYRDVADNSIVRLTPAKMQGYHDYTYPAPLPGPGRYTVLIRFSNGSSSYSFFSCDAKFPTFIMDGLKTHIGNIDNVKTIRIAPGEWETASQIKRADGSVSFNASTIASKIDNDGFFTITHSKSSNNIKYTISVEYYDGYTTVRSFTVEKKQPVVQFTDNSAEFTSLDDLQIIRYAKGNYTTVAEIKNAIKNKYINSSSVIDDTVIISSLEGEYTFFVQYYDGSTNYIYHTF